MACRPSGHQDIVLKALGIFDYVIVAQGKNPEKTGASCLSWKTPQIFLDGYHFTPTDPRVTHQHFSGSLLDMVREFKPNAIIRGLRNGNDLQYEMNQQYWNEDVGIEIPFVYFITDRKLSHVSSSSIKMVEGVRFET